MEAVLSKALHLLSHLKYGVRYHEVSSSSDILESCPASACTHIPFRIRWLCSFM